jgi:hypothetical protein
MIEVSKNGDVLYHRIETGSFVYLTENVAGPVYVRRPFVVLGNLKASLLVAPMQTNKPKGKSGIGAVEAFTDSGRGGFISCYNARMVSIPNIQATGWDFIQEEYVHRARSVAAMGIMGALMSSRAFNVTRDGVADSSITETDIDMIGEMKNDG